jgi:hypothetical protein
LKIDGASVFEPTEGRPMTGYITVPKAWMNQAELVKPWIKRSLNWTSKLPEKKRTKSKTTKKKS